MNNYFSNLKVYNREGKRVAIFGLPSDDDEILVFELTCSKKDQFCKATAKQVFEIYQNATDSFDGKCNGCIYHPKIYTIKAEDPKRPKWSFLKYINNNFYKQFLTTIEYSDDIEVVELQARVNGKTKTVIIKTLERWESKDK